MRITAHRTDHLCRLTTSVFIYLFIYLYYNVADAIQGIIKKEKEKEKHM